ncbi:hypothetical protein [Sphingomonas melonis]|uniref:Phage protein n=1 Tax=Sphingomonas melonis TaxID=152682 RepID=A0A7Y9K4H7_9SPHN|nr:hypothetical protein [Sphingomonas melonis]NYD91400.1 hypothetical protein [Sphingomonas melonis]
MTPERDNTTGMFPAEAITPGVYAADSAAILVDMLNFASAVILIHVGVGGINFTNANKVEMVLTAGNADDGSDQVPVTDADIIVDGLAPAAINNGIVRSLVAAKPAADIQKVGYIGGKRYLRLVADFSGAHGTGTPIAATVIRSRPALRGVA